MWKIGAGSSCDRTLSKILERKMVSTVFISKSKTIWFEGNRAILCCFMEEGLRPFEWVGRHLGGGRVWDYAKRPSWTWTNLKRGDWLDDVNRFRLLSSRGDNHNRAKYFSISFFLFFYWNPEATSVMMRHRGGEWEGGRKKPKRKQERKAIFTGRNITFRKDLRVRCGLGGYRAGDVPFNTLLSLTFNFHNKTKNWRKKKEKTGDEQNESTHDK